MKASDLFVKCLEQEGVERIFGVPGEENADFMISLEDSPVEFILCRHEQGVTGDFVIWEVPRTPTFHVVATYSDY